MCQKAKVHLNVGVFNLSSTVFIIFMDQNYCTLRYNRVIYVAYKMLAEMSVHLCKVKKDSNPVS